VRAAYRRRVTRAMPMRYIMMWLTGSRKAMRPAKKRRREACKRKGIVSTMVCIRKRFNPK
jgi:hypothetical protein